MFLILAIIFGAAWFLDYAVVHVTSGGASVLLISAVACAIAHVVRGRSASRRRLTSS